VIERVQFWWMVMDLGTAFLYEWASTVAKTSYCHARDDGVLLARAPGYPLLGIFGWDAMGILDAIKMRNIDFFNGYGVASGVGPGQVLATASLQCVLEGEGGGWAMMRVRCLTGPRAGLTMEVREDVAEGAQVLLAAQGPTATNEAWMAEIKVNGLFNVIAPTLNFHATSPNPP
jgi:hypothetical protein